ncbi:MAG: MFS transporter [Candidatus Saccharimonadales bacterium]
MIIDKNNQKIVLWSMILAVSMTTIDQTIVALSADTIQTGLGVSHSVIVWSINAYILATAAFFLLGGKLADVFGHKRMVVIGIALFALFSLLCGLTPSGDIAGPWLITARALQGVSTALMFPAALGIVRAGFPLESRGKASATFFSITGAMTAIGPIVGGYLTDWTWRSIFWINVPIAIVALALIAKRKIEDKSERHPIDWQGGALIAASMGLSIAGLQQAGTWGWDSVLTWLFIAAGLAFLVAFIQFERKAQYPLVKLHAFKNRGFSLSVLATFFSSMAFIPIFFFISVYAQISLGLDVSTSGLLLLEFFIGFTVASIYGGKIFDKKGARIPLIMGGLLGGIGFAWWASKLSILTDGGSFLSSPQFFPTVLAGAGIGFMFSAASTDIANRSSEKAFGESTAISQTAKNFGGALGLALLATLLATQLNTNLVNSFTALGASASDAQSVAKDINSQAQGDKQNSSSESSLPKDVQDKFNNAVRDGYAESTKTVFYSMSGAMFIILILGLMYPKHEEINIRKV